MNRNKGIEKTTFSKLEISDNFFDSLRERYEGFDKWFVKKQLEDKTCYAKFSDEGKIEAFLYFKHETEKIELNEKTIIPKDDERIMKIGTFKVSDDASGQRISEAFVREFHMRALEKKFNYIYITMFEEYAKLKIIMEKYGFELIGTKKDTGELVLWKNMSNESDCANKVYPYINWKTNTFGKIIPVDNEWHSDMFGVPQQERNENILPIANGINKIFISHAHLLDDKFKKDDVVFIYRNKYTNLSGQEIKGAITSIGVCSSVIKIRSDYKYSMSYDDFLNTIGNKTVYSEEQLRKKYDEEKNIYLISFISSKFFKKNEVSISWLFKNDLWSKGNDYPYSINYSKDESKKILMEAGKDVQDIIIN